MYRMKFQLIRTMTVIFIAVFLLAGCGKPEDATADPVVSGIARSVKMDGSVRISDSTDFEWDQLYIFPPYSLFDDMEKMVGSGLSRTNALLGISVDEGFCYFVFLKEGTVVKAVYVHRFPGDFSSVKIGPHSPETARFEAHLNGDWCIRGRWRVMKQVSPIQ